MVKAPLNTYNEQEQNTLATWEAALTRISKIDRYVTTCPSGLLKAIMPEHD